MKNYPASVSLLLLAAAIVALAGGCGKSSPADSGKGGPVSDNQTSDSITTSYRRLQTELLLAQSKKAYLVLDLPHRQLQLKLGGAVVWNHPLLLSDTSAGAIRSFSERISNPRQGWVRTVKERHLFASKDQTPDSILSIVGEALKIDPKLIQRELPQKFQLVFDDGFIMEFRSGVEGADESGFKSTYLNASTALKRLFGEVYMVSTLDSQAALTLYRAADTGMVLLVSSSL